MLQNVKKALANPEPSTHGTQHPLLRRGDMSGVGLQTGSDRHSAKVAPRGDHISLKSAFGAKRKSDSGLPDAVMTI